MERCQGSRPVHRGLQRRPPSSAVHRGRLLALMSWVPLWALALCGVPWAPLAVRGAPLPSGAPFFTLRQWVRYAGQATFAGKPANPPCLKKNLKSQAMSPRDSTLVTSHLPAWEEALLNATVARHRQSGGIPRIPFHRSQAQSGAQRRGDRSLRELLEASRKRASTRGTASAYHRAVVGRLSILSPPATAAHNARGEREEREMPKSRRGLQAQGRGLAKDKTGPSRRVTSFDGIDALQMASAGSRPKYNGSSGYTTPPDVSGCVGSGYIVQVVNKAIVVFNTNGETLAGPVPYSQFLGLTPYINQLGYLGDDAFDGQCIYDRNLRRFFISLVFAHNGGPSRYDCLGQRREGDSPFGGSALLIIVSAQGNPTRPWDVYLVPTTNDGRNSHNDQAPPFNLGTAPFFGDYPQLGIDLYGVYLTSSQASGPADLPSITAFNIYAFGKFNLLNRKDFLGMRYVVRNSDSVAEAIGIRTPYPYKASAEPKSTIEAANGGTMYFVAVSFESKATFLGVYAITNTSALNTPPLRPTSLNPASFRFLLTLAPCPRFVSAPDSVPQRGRGASEIETNSRNPYISTVLVLGNLWASWSVGWPGKPTLSAVAVAQLKPTFRKFQGQLQLSAKVSFMRVLRVPGHSLVYPALAFTRFGKGLLAFSLLGGSFYPSAAYTLLDGRKIYLSPSVRVIAPGARSLFDSTDPAQDSDPDAPAGDSQAIRFGDWNMATVDELGRAWAFVEYVNARKPDPEGNWGTRIFKVPLL